MQRYNLGDLLNKDSTENIVKYVQLEANLNDKMHLMTSRPNEDSDQPAHSQNLIRIVVQLSLESKNIKTYSRMAKSLIRLVPQYAHNFDTMSIQR